MPIESLLMPELRCALRLKSGATQTKPASAGYGILTFLIDLLHKSYKCPLNPRQVLYLGRPQDRTGSPILGDFKSFSPQNWGSGGRRSTFARGLIVRAGGLSLCSRDFNRLRIKVSSSTPDSRFPTFKRDVS
jgi:hypothetical protein